MSVDALMNFNAYTRRHEEENPMSRLQLALNVDDLDEAVAYYSALFDTEPAKLESGYANFAIANPPLKLVLFEGAGVHGSINHLGVEHQSADDVHSELDRVKAAGLPVHSEGEDHCCFAYKDEGWVDGVDGHRWEIYTVLGDAETAGPTTSNCCDPEAKATVGAPACC
jgi:catechol 2,3-dioxygenase-like lactoylglutathione lyase family enzyme